MIDKIALAACFRHYPEDGDTIPASIERKDPTCEWETMVDPIIGFMAILVGSRVNWSFIKYEATDERFKRGSNVPIRKMARMSIARVGHISCESCGNCCIYPVWDRPEKFRCPSCGHKGIYVSWIKERSDEFFQMLGDLKEPLEEAVKAVDPATANEFRFPELMLLGRLSPSANILPKLQWEAHAKGLSLRLARETLPDELFRNPAMQGPDTGLLIMPGIVTGVLDAYQAQVGWMRSEGLVIETVRLPWLSKVPVSKTAVLKDPVMTATSCGARF